MNDSFFYRAKQTVYKWWCVIYKPVYKLMHHGYWPAEKEPYYVPPQPTPQKPDVAPEDVTLDLGDTADSTIAEAPVNNSNMQEAPTESTPSISDEDAAKRAQEIMDRLNREAAADEAKKQAEIDAARRKAEEDARLASILKSTQRDISQYISEGIASRETIPEGTATQTASADDEALRRAQEIMDRLNREAAEDEAKKQAEIDAAKEYARQHNL